MEKKKVIEFFGGVRKTARALGISHAAVINWGDQIPVGRAYQVQVLSKGKLKVERAVSA